MTVCGHARMQPNGVHKSNAARFQGKGKRLADARCPRLGAPAHFDDQLSARGQGWALRSGDGGQPPQRSALLSSMPACLRALRRRRPPARRCSTTCRHAAWRRTWSPAAA